VPAVSASAPPVSARRAQAPGEQRPDAPAVPGYIVTGVAVRDEPSDEMLALITSPLVDYDVTIAELDGGITQIVVRPPGG
jgi:hypothetical protein